MHLHQGGPNYVTVYTVFTAAPATQTTTELVHECTWHRCARQRPMVIRWSRGVGMKYRVVVPLVQLTGKYKLVRLRYQCRKVWQELKLKMLIVLIPFLFFAEIQFSWVFFLTWLFKCYVNTLRQREEDVASNSVFTAVAIKVQFWSLFNVSLTNQNTYTRAA